MPSIEVVKLAPTEFGASIRAIEAQLGRKLKQNERDIFRKLAKQSAGSSSERATSAFTKTGKSASNSRSVTKSANDWAYKPKGK